MRVHIYVPTPPQKNTAQSCLSWRSGTCSYLFPSPPPWSPFLFPSCDKVHETTERAIYLDHKIKGFMF